MQEIRLLKIGFGSYIKIFLFSGLGIGVILGVLMFIIALLGGPVTANVGSTDFSGIGAGIASLIIAPIASTLIFAWFSLFMYPCFLLVLKVFKGMKIKASLDAGYNQGYAAYPQNYAAYPQEPQDNTPAQ